MEKELISRPNAVLEVKAAEIPSWAQQAVSTCIREAKAESQLEETLAMLINSANEIDQVIHNLSYTISPDSKCIKELCAIRGKLKLRAKFFGEYIGRRE